MGLNKKSIIELLMIVLILTDSILLILMIFYNFSPLITQIIYIFDLIVCFVLGIEFVYELNRSDNRKHYLQKNWYYIIAMIPDYLLNIVLSLFGLAGISWFVRLIRLLRIGRVLILFKKNIKIFTDFVKETHLDKLLTFLIILVISSSIVFFIVDESADSFIDGLWYVLVTLSTVGYGDIVPSTISGRIIGFVLIIIGILSFSILTGAISSIYTKRIEEETKNEIDERLNRIEAKLDKLLENQ